MSVDGQAFGGITVFTLVTFGIILAMSRVLKEKQTLLAIVTMVITFFGLWLITAFARARDAVRVRKIISPDTQIFYSNELATGYVWQFWKTHGDNPLFHPACPECPVCLECPVCQECPVCPDCPEDSSGAETYMLRPVPLDDITQGKPSGCNL